MKRLNLTASANQRSMELLEFFRVNSVQHPGVDSPRRVLPLKAFEEYAGINAAEHPLFFRQELFAGGSDFNVYNGFHYLTIDGLFKADTVLTVADLIRKEIPYGQNQPA